MKLSEMGYWWYGEMNEEERGEWDKVWCWLVEVVLWENENGVEVYYE